MMDYIEIIKANPSGVLATQNGDKLDTRVLHSLFEEVKAYIPGKGTTREDAAC